MNGPLGRQGIFEGQKRGFGGVIRGLGLRIVGPVGRDGCEEDDAAAGVLGDHLSECGVSHFAGRFGVKGLGVWDGKAAYRAAACAERKEPVVLISSLLFHSEGVMSIACVHPTTPAKQHSISTLPNSDTVSLTADSNCSAFVTSTLIESTVAFGKSVLSASIS